MESVGHFSHMPGQRMHKWNSNNNSNPEELFLFTLACRCPEESTGARIMDGRSTRRSANGLYSHQASRMSRPSEILGALPGINSNICPKNSKTGSTITSAASISLKLRIPSDHVFDCPLLSLTTSLGSFRVDWLGSVGAQNELLRKKWRWFPPIGGNSKAYIATGD
jgi:hypothetical protein